MESASRAGRKDRFGMAHVGRSRSAGVRRDARIVATPLAPPAGRLGRMEGLHPASRNRNQSSMTTAAKGSFAFISLGCPKNTVDSERMLGKLAQDGYALSADAGGADVDVGNTCGLPE